MTKPATTPAPLRLVRSAVKPCQETIDALTQLLDLAIRGEVTGIAFACSVRDGSRFITNVTGRCFENPTFTRGALAFLQDQVATLQHQLPRDGPR
ncbi:hypothetical protein E5CHR_04236 [Variovorax sp. PBL-E5]|nr:hypothetical protein E5CHR_04236 [Variovorax sp. PBL-E5]